MELPSFTRTVMILGMLAASLTPLSGQADSPPAASGNDAPFVVERFKFPEYRRHHLLEQADAAEGRSFTFSSGLEVISDMEGVELRMDGRRRGITPWESNSVSPGSHVLRMERSGYAPLEIRVFVKADERTRVTFDMIENTGFLILKNLPPNAGVTVNGLPVEENRTEHPAGPLRLRVEVFGWTTIEDAITLDAGENLIWTYTGSRSSFEAFLSDIRPSTLPVQDDKGFRISWRATAPGSGLILILDSLKNTVFSQSFAIKGTSGSLNWKPADMNTTPEEGSYTVILQAQGGDGIEAYDESLITLDSRFLRKARLGAPILPGLLEAPGTAMLPPGIVQTSTTVGTRLAIPINSGSMIWPMQTALRVSFATGWEAGGRFFAAPTLPSENTGFGLSTYLSWRLLSALIDINTALSFTYGCRKASFNSPVLDPPSDLPGILLTVPLSWNRRGFSLTLSVGTYAAFFGADTENTFLAMPVSPVILGTFGIHYESDIFFTGMSVSYRSPALYGSNLPQAVRGAIEWRIDIPKTSTYLGLAGRVFVFPQPIEVEALLELGMVL